MASKSARRPGREDEVADAVAAGSRSFDKAGGKAAIHMVSAWATANHISLGQVVTDAKSNEITAIPKLLELIEMSGALVTIDALGCQTEIAAKIVERKADYCLAVKGNQPTLHAGLMDFFESHLADDFARTKVRRWETIERGHGREERRTYFLCPVPDDLPDRERWAGLKAIGVAISHTVRNGNECCEVRYYILSKYVSGKRFAAAVRGHWSIENRLHWQLDVTFQEDQCRIRKGHGGCLPIKAPSVPCPSDPSVVLLSRSDATGASCRRIATAGEPAGERMVEHRVVLPLRLAGSLSRGPVDRLLEQSGEGFPREVVDVAE